MWGQRDGCLHWRICRDSELGVFSAEGIVVGSPNGDSEMPATAIASIGVDRGCIGIGIELELGCDLDGCKGRIRDDVVERTYNWIREVDGDGVGWRGHHNDGRVVVA